MENLLADVAARYDFDLMVAPVVGKQSYREVGQDDEEVIWRVFVFRLSCRCLLGSSLGLFLFFVVLSFSCVDHDALLSSIDSHVSG